MAKPAVEGRDAFSPGEDHVLRELFHRQLAMGRSVLFVAQGAVGLLLFLSGQLSPLALLIQGFFSLYCVATLFLVRRAMLSRLPLGGLLALDMLWVTLIADHTGGSGSPFLGLYYLIVLAAALLYELAGGLLVGLAAALFAALLGFLHPAGSGHALWRDLRNVAVYYVLVGGFTGFLVAEAKGWFRQFQESQAEIQARMVREEVERRELALARRIQEAALPSDAPRVPGLDIAVRMEFAREVGGDFYLFLSGEPGQEEVGLVVGDVSGKGIPAALLSTTIAYLLPGLSPLGNPPGALHSLNLALLERLPAAAFVSLVLAVVNQSDGKLCLWSAGHPPALLWRAGEQRVVEAEVFNRVLGVPSDAECRPEEWPFQAGDILLLYTDGLSEAQNPRRELFHSSRAAKVLEENAGRTAEEIAAALVGAARAWGTLADDVTLVVCKRLPAPPASPNLARGISDVTSGRAAVAPSSP